MKQTNSAAMALSPEHRFMKAWNAYQETDDFMNSLMWATLLVYPHNGERIPEISREQHAKGSMWAAFTKGMEIAEETAVNAYDPAKDEALQLQLLSRDADVAELLADNQALREDAQNAISRIGEKDEALRKMRLALLDIRNWSDGGVWPHKVGISQFIDKLLAGGVE
jgi:hypothetical protein